MSIPKVFHRVWLGGEMPVQFEAFGRAWLEMNPGWTMQTWDESVIETLDNRANCEKARTYSEKSDFIRHEVLVRHGGVYIDTDFQPLKPLGSLLDGVEAFCGTEDNYHASMGILMREDPLELLAGNPRARANWLARRTGLDATAIWEWGAVERVSTGLLCSQIELQPVGREMLAVADRVAED